jgi:hypothetical protein
MFQFELTLAKKCIVNDQLPAGIDVRPGTPLSVANDAIVPLTVVANVTDVFVSAEPDGVGLHCFLVGEPNALLVFVE